MQIIALPTSCMLRCLGIWYRIAGGIVRGNSLQFYKLHFAQVPRSLCPATCSLIRSYCRIFVSPGKNHDMGSSGSKNIRKREGKAVSVKNRSNLSSKAEGGNKDSTAATTTASGAVRQELLATTMDAETEYVEAVVAKASEFGDNE